MMSFMSLLLSKFVNMMMKHGDKILAREIMSDVRKYRSYYTHLVIGLITKY